MKEAEAISFLLALLLRLNQAGGIARESSHDCIEAIAWLEERKAAFERIAGDYKGEIPNEYDGWGA